MKVGEIKELKTKVGELEGRVEALEVEKAAVEKELKDSVNTNQVS